MRPISAVLKLFKRQELRGAPISVDAAGEIVSRPHFSKIHTRIFLFDASRPKRESAL